MQSRTNASAAVAAGASGGSGPSLGSTAAAVDNAGAHEPGHEHPLTDEDVAQHRPSFHGAEALIINGGGGGDDDHEDQQHDAQMRALHRRAAGESAVNGAAGMPCLGLHAVDIRVVVRY